MNHLWCASAAAFVLTAACATELEVEEGRRPIVDGMEDTGDPGVVAIGSRRLGCTDALQVFCTGTAVAPNVVLTAAHCLDEERSGRGLEVAFGASVTDPAAVHHYVAEVAVHPDYDPVTNRADLMLLRLAEEVAVDLVSLQTAALDDSLIGTSVRVAGFGDGRSPEDPVGVKRTGLATVTEIDEGTFRIEPGPAMSCQGDSGGPVFLADGGGDVLIGITSFGDPGCTMFGVSIRVDPFITNFIQPFIDDGSASMPPPASLDFDEICQVECAADADCPIGSCAVPIDGPARCAYGALPSGNFGMPCASDDDCSDCLRVRADDIPGACLCYSECESGLDLDDGDGCCTVAPGTRGDRYPVVELLLAFVGFAMRRRARR